MLSVAWVSWIYNSANLFTINTSGTSRIKVYQYLLPKQHTLKPNQIKNILITANIQPKNNFSDTSECGASQLSPNEHSAVNPVTKCSRNDEKREAEKTSSDKVIRTIHKGHRKMSRCHHNQEILRGHSSPLYLGPHLFCFYVSCDLWCRREVATDPNFGLCSSCVFFRICPHPAVNKINEILAAEE